MSRAQQIRPVDPVAVYERSGDFRLSNQRLMVLHDQLQSRSRPTSWMVAAHICLDLSQQDTAHADYWINTADAHLTDIITTHTLLSEYEQPNSYAALAHVAIDAAARKAELANWAQASGGEPLTIDYPYYIEAAAKIAEVADESIQANSSAIEFLPVLLGARAMHRSGNGWFGRKSLAREDSRRGDLHAVNPNWDTGIMLDDDSSNFANPNIKLQMKLAKRRRSTRYERAGITLVTATKHQLGDATSITASCLAEYNMFLPSLDYDAVPLLDSAQLDAVTESLRQAILPAADALDRP